MERFIIYGLALCGILAGLVMFYRRPSPFGRRTYDSKKRSK